MIRPLTIATFLMACGSGLYLYQSKHEVQLLDRTIEKSVHDTAALREQSRLLAAEWTMLNDPERLRQFSDTFLNLRTINPAQFTSLASLNDKLPAPQAEVSTSGEEQEPISIESMPQPESESTVGGAGPVAAVAGDKILPVPPVPVLPPTPVVAALARVADPKVAAARAVNMEAAARSIAPVASRPPEQRSPEPRAPESRAPESRAAKSRAAEGRPSEIRAAEAHAENHAPSAPRPIVLAAPRLQPVVSSPIGQPTRAAMAQAPGNEPRTVQSPIQAPPSQVAAFGVAASQMPPAARPPVLAQSARQAPAPVSSRLPGGQLPGGQLSGVIPGPAPFSGSLLGMARGSMPPAPRPTPVNATYNAN